MQKLRSRARVVKSVASGRLARSKQASGPAASAKSRLSSGAETGPRRRSYVHLPWRKPSKWVNLYMPVAWVVRRKVRRRPRRHHEDRWEGRRS